ncbi:hypothetical protein GMB70_14970 [Turicibacter sanguinis]|uniref:hypothetical protein n=1 Tax=Turicibacter sanguinis TaxID=154288 RepID=UPI0012BD63D9|nr:hypothetical protein [Turicibacter sanguinis]MCU7195524.1 hypothetical protein [Turicibacter sanguinis]MTP79940.1 hypothetical protein [Turicibacter sanguinis]
MDERQQQAALLVDTIHKLCTEFGFVLEPFTLDSGLTVISIYDIKENKRLFMANKEEKKCQQN